MTINEVIKRLEELREAGGSGDILVEVRNGAGDFSDIDESASLYLSRYGKKDLPIVRIDA